MIEFCILKLFELMLTKCTSRINDIIDACGATTASKTILTTLRVCPHVLFVF